jgi:hypothetical protein
MPDLQQTVKNLKQELREVKERTERLEEIYAQEQYVPVRALAEGDNEWPDSYSGFISMMKRRGIPKRTREGRVKKAGSKRTTYVSTYDLE